MRSQRPQPMLLSHEALEKIFAYYRIPAGNLEESTTARAAKSGHRPARGLILFAFRGSLPNQTLQGWVRKAVLHPSRVDHIHMHCTLGIWDPEHKRIFVAPGSTVPHKDRVVLAAARKGKLQGKGTNQLEPGFYTDLSKGEHLQGKLNGHQALRQTAGRFYRRSLTGLPYTNSSPLYFGNPYDNLHCGWNLDGVSPGYSSAGCLVVAGIPRCPRHETPLDNQGPWKRFHDFLYEAEQKVFPLLLLPFASVVSALNPEPAKESGLRRNLVYGSIGDAVKDLQRRLRALSSYRGPINGRLDARTYRAWKSVL